MFVQPISLKKLKNIVNLRNGVKNDRSHFIAVMNAVVTGKEVTELICSRVNKVYFCSSKICHATVFVTFFPSFLIYWS